MCSELTARAPSHRVRWTSLLDMVTGMVQDQVLASVCALLVPQTCAGVFKLDRAGPWEHQGERALASARWQGGAGSVSWAGPLSSLCCVGQTCPTEPPTPSCWGSRLSGPSQMSSLSQSSCSWRGHLTKYWPM